MIKKRYFKTKHEVEVTFEVSVPDVDGVSVLCDVTGWEPVPMKSVRGRWRASLRLPLDRQVQFRYLAANGHWITDDEADGHVGNEYGGQNAVVDTSRP
ncbi:MAG: isoamylase early set domain-containing protein [Acidimicrobiia bacterium]|nr:isoamylase early set domain-containing protein [Acidimicrobiia bacterium]